MGDRMVNNVGYTIIDKNEHGALTIRAIVGGNSVEVVFGCFEIEYNNDFEFVQKRLRDIIKNSLTAI
jgi:hypothetical protein